MKKYFSVVSPRSEEQSQNQTNENSDRNIANPSSSSSTSIEMKRNYNQKARVAWTTNPAFKNWLVINSKDESVVNCKFCNCLLKPKLSVIRQHSLSQKHKTAAAPFSCARQKKIILVQSQIKTKVQEAEARLALYIAKHASIRSIDHLTKVNKINFHDSSISSNLNLSRTKCSKIIENIWSPFFKKELRENVGDGPYSLLIDESTDRSVIKYIGLVIRYFNKRKSKCETKFLKLQPIEQSDAAGIVLGISSVLDEFKLDIANLCGIGTDNANVMTGARSGVIKRLQEINPKIILIPCVCHSLQLAISAATKGSIPESIEFLVNETYNWFALSSQRQSEYRKLYSLINDDQCPLKIIQKSDTRWLSIEVAVSRICTQYLELETHFKLAASGKKCYKAQILRDLYENKLNFVYLLFLRPILKEVQMVNKVFESNNADFVKVFNDLSCLILSLIKKIAVFPEAESELSADMVVDKLLPNPYFGFECEEKLLGLRSQHLISLEDENEFRKNCKNFILKLIKELQTRTPENQKILKQINFFSVKKCLRIHKQPLTDFIKNRKMNSEFATKIETQWNNLHLNVWENIDNTVDFWCEVNRFTDASNENPYEELSNLALSYLVLPISNAAVERVFSFMNLVKDQRRNRMKINMLNSILLIRDTLSENCCDSFTIPDHIIKEVGSAKFYFTSDEERDLTDVFEDALNDAQHF